VRSESAEVGHITSVTGTLDTYAHNAYTHTCVHTHTYVYVRIRIRVRVWNVYGCVYVFVYIIPKCEPESARQVRSASAEARHITSVTYCRVLGDTISYERGIPVKVSIDRHVCAQCIHIYHLCVCTCTYAYRGLYTYTYVFAKPEI